MTIELRQPIATVIRETSGPTNLGIGACPTTSLLAVVGGSIVGLSPSLAGDFARWSGTAWSMSSGSKDYRTTDTVEASIGNLTPATSSIPIQRSGILELAATAHDTDGNVSVTERWGFQVRPVNGNTVYSTLDVLRSQNDGARSSLFRFNYNGLFYVGSGLYIADGYQVFGTNGLTLYNSHASGIGAGTGVEIKGQGNQPIIMHAGGLTDAASAVGIYLGIDNAGGTWTNAATIRCVSFGTGKRDAPATWTERGAVFADGSMWSETGFRFPAYATTGLPTAGAVGQVIYCSNGDAGNKCLAMWDGSNWLRIALGAAVAAV